MWRPAELGNSKGKGAPVWGGRLCAAEGNPAQASVSAPSTAGGHLAKNFMQLLGHPKGKDKTM